MRIHPEGVEALRYIGLFFFILLLFILRFTNVASGIFGWLFDRGLSRFPTDKRNRRQWKKLALTKEGQTRQKLAFWCLVSALAVWAALNFFVFPQQLQVSARTLLAAAAGVFWAGVVVIFVGPVRSGRGRNWSRWTFLISVIITASIVFWIASWAGPNPRTIVGALGLGALAFLWGWGFFQRVDRSEDEIRGLGISKSYDGSTPIMQVTDGASAGRKSPGRR